MGFDSDLSKEINVDVSPTETVVINGFPSYSSKFKDISLVTNERLVGDSNIKIKYARANNPFEVYNLLENIKSEDKDNTFMKFAPLGTKPMALGACLSHCITPTCESFIRCRTNTTTNIRMTAGIHGSIHFR